MEAIRRAPDVWQQLEQFRSGGTEEGRQVLGLLGSRYVALAIAVGFVISRVHVLVHRPQVRTLGAALRVALYGPVAGLLIRALLAQSTALAGRGTGAWMAAVTEHAAQLGRSAGVEASAGAALWQAYVAMCAFDCVDVFVARLEGSACVASEYMGGVVERTALFHFYGASTRVQELAMACVAEKLLQAVLLLAVRGGWRWRLLPTAAGNALLLHHFVFSMRHGPRAAYPLVQVLAMTLISVALAVVVVTVAVSGLARAVDCLAAPPRRAPAAPLYNRAGVFQGAADDDAPFELARDVLMPICPDLRRDFGVEILDLAAACLQQCSSQVRASGLARPCGPVRLPRATALDDWANAAVAPRRGMDAFIDDEPIPLPPPHAAHGLVTAIQGTRLSSIRRLSLETWALVLTLVHYLTKKKMIRPAKLALSTSNRSHVGVRRLFNSRDGNRVCQQELDSDAHSDPGSEFDYDYVCSASDSSDSSDDASGSDDAISEPDILTAETASLVADILSTTSNDPSGDRLAAVATFMAHTVLSGDSDDSTVVVTRSMCSRRLAHINSDVDHPPLPFVRRECDALAQLITSCRDSRHMEDSDTRSMCVVCWTNSRSVMLRPCRCLCLCNDCRAALVVRNFDHCPCCRRPVAGYSRVYAV
ncbi:hypothetical protein COEREDRAFT_93026 [Coemansia reversa NRRL 1564]|uniref:RING-type domain-containing protein n=1 Tax=Coemansia reversa (strain ATCC 12441 / NRRL 1564) TaxID=763665 RepID=A0A2G5BAS8_COERN|nr:hypothetical protein COEREDRAFT_93026 [Coemansia reversa NRRL 1564]|eukprot:PIA15817.1 hypothetical protein COEREDRAFT_93026 [Coemansia reversa NRRL 1564]